MSKKCIKCGAELADADLFCGECGTKQPQAAAHCSNCGEEVSSNSKFCPNCGKPINGASVPTAAKPSSAYPDCIITEPNADTICINVKGVKFNMKLVEGGMLDKYTELSDFYIGETVVTQELWQMVMGDNPSEDNSNLQLPVTGMNTAMCNAFMRQLKKLTGADFCLPTVYQWQYAHDGGKKANKKTKYAGSDNADEVAWTSLNSGNKLHPVAMLNANELGLYDMDGNVQEYCKGKKAQAIKYQHDPIPNQEIGLLGYNVTYTIKFKDVNNRRYEWLKNKLKECAIEHIEDVIKTGIIKKGLNKAEAERINRHFDDDDIVIEKDSCSIGVRIALDLSSKSDKDSPINNILKRQILVQEARKKAEEQRISEEKRAEAEEKKRREAEALARKHLTHTLTITAVKDQLAGMMATRIALGWTPSESREKFTKLPIEIMVSDDKAFVVKVYKQLTAAGIEVDVSTINGLGEFVDGALEDDQRLLASCKSGNVFTGFQSKYKNSITEYTIPDKYTSIADKAFMDCVNLVTINLPDTIQSIGEYAFYGCKSLESIRIPSLVTLIPRKCFEGCERLHTVEIPDSVIDIKGFAFHNCRNLKKLKLPTALKKIGATSLDGSGVERMRIPKGVEIGNRTIECLEGL